MSVLRYEHVSPKLIINENINVDEVTKSASKYCNLNNQKKSKKWPLCYKIWQRNGKSPPLWGCWKMNWQSKLDQQLHCSMHYSITRKKSYLPLVIKIILMKHLIITNKNLCNHDSNLVPSVSHRPRLHFWHLLLW